MKRFLLALVVCLCAPCLKESAQAQVPVTGAVEDSVFTHYRMIAEMIAMPPTYQPGVLNADSVNGAWSDTLYIAGWEEGVGGVFERISGNYYSEKNLGGSFIQFMSGYVIFHIGRIWQLKRDYQQIDASSPGGKIRKTIPKNTLVLSIRTYSNFSDSHGRFIRLETHPQVLETLSLVINQDTVSLKESPPCDLAFPQRRLTGSQCLALDYSLIEHDELHDIKIIGQPVYVVAWRPGPFVARRTDIPGTVLLHWKVPIGVRHDLYRWLGMDRPSRVLDIETEQGMYYEYQIFGGGNTAWQSLLTEETKAELTLNNVGFYDLFRTYAVRDLDPAGTYSFCIRAVNMAGTSEKTCDLTPVQPVLAEGAEIPVAVTLSQNYPNPFNPVTTITYALDLPGPVEMTVYDLTGRSVKTLVDGVQPAGEYAVRFEAGGLPSGTYVYRLRTGSETLTKSMTLLR